MITKKNVYIRHDLYKEVQKAFFHFLLIGYDSITAGIQYAMQVFT